MPQVSEMGRKEFYGQTGWRADDGKRRKGAPNSCSVIIISRNLVELKEPD